MAKRRLIAPERKTVAREVFEHPAFASYGDALDLLRMEDWPSLDLLNSFHNRGVTFYADNWIFHSFYQ